MFRYGLECLFHNYRYGLEKKFRPGLYRDFQAEAIRDYENGNLFSFHMYHKKAFKIVQIFIHRYILGQVYGLKAFQAFLECYKHIGTLKVDSKLEKFLSEYKKIEDLQKAEKVKKKTFRKIVG